MFPVRALVQLAVLADAPLEQGAALADRLAQRTLELVDIPSESRNEAAIAAHLAERLVGYKCPDDIRIVDALPVTGAQKLDRMALRRLARGGE